MSKVGHYDETGLRYLGRHTDDRYIYESVPVVGGSKNRVLLTHDQRVGLAILRKLARLIRPDVQTPVYPMTRQSGHAGYGNQGFPGVWIRRPDLEERGIWTGVDTLIHELAHNAQPMGTKPHGSAFKSEETRLRVRARKVTKGFRVLPEIDRRKMRDSMGPRAKKAAAKDRRRVVAKKTKVQEWTERVERAKAKLDEWESKWLRAQSAYERWEKRLSHAKTFLQKAQDREGGLDE